MITIDIPDATRCKHCNESPITVFRDGKLYCGDNCALYDEVARNVGTLQDLVATGRCGSPIGIKQAATLMKHLEQLKPVRPSDSCVNCWGGMQGGYQKLDDYGKGRMVERCVYCGWEREQRTV